MARRAETEGLGFGNFLPRGYAPKGPTPVLVLSPAKRERINLISAVTHQA